MGGAIALELALRAPMRPWLSALILVGTGARLRVRPDLIDLLTTDFDAAVDSIIRQSISAQNLRVIRPLLEQCLRRVGAEVIRGDLLACNGFDVMERLSDVAVPSLVLVGADDRMTPVKYSEHLWNNLPESAFSVIPGAGHLVMCERQTNMIGPIVSFTAYIRSRGHTDS
ncbi:MAG: hypothetical protein NVS2B16_05950 [Chloroflexota bacterium]